MFGLDPKTAIRYAENARLLLTTRADEQDPASSTEPKGQNHPIEPEDLPVHRERPSVQLNSVVCCQLGLQFFPDRPAALAEMARTLLLGGRLAVLVWRSIGRSPGFAVLAAALDRHIGPAAGAMMRAPFGWSDQGTLRDLVAGAGFREVKLNRQAGVVRFGSARELVVAYGAGSPLAGAIGAAAAAGGVADRGPGRAGPMAGRGRAGLPDPGAAGQRPQVGGAEDSSPGRLAGSAWPFSP